MKHLSRTYYLLIFYLSWLVFGAVGFLLNLVCIVLLPMPRTEGLQRLTRAGIRALFDLWMRWLHATGVVRVRWVGFPARLPTGTVYIANHPTLVDATFLLSRLPDAFCIFKPALMRNPFIAPAAVLGGYVSGGRNVDTIREAAMKVAAGQSLLVFPEGTRTSPGARIGRFRPGFALIAHRGRSPVQAILIRSSPDLLVRGRPWWVPPRALPASVEITFGRSWEFDPADRSVDLAAQVERYVASQIPEPAP